MDAIGAASTRRTAPRCGLTLRRPRGRRGTSSPGRSRRTIRTTSPPPPRRAAAPALTRRGRSRRAGTRTRHRAGPPWEAAAKSKAETDATRRALTPRRRRGRLLERDAAAMAGAAATRSGAAGTGSGGKEGRRAPTGSGGTGRHRATVRGEKAAASAIDLNRRMCEAIEAMPVRSGRWPATGRRTMTGTRTKETGRVLRRRRGSGANVARGQGRPAGGVAPHPREMRTLRREARTLARSWRGRRWRRCEPWRRRACTGPTISTLLRFRQGSRWVTDWRPSR